MGVKSVENHENFKNSEIGEIPEILKGKSGHSIFTGNDILQEYTAKFSNNDSSHFYSFMKFCHSLK